MRENTATFKFLLLQIIPTKYKPSSPKKHSRKSRYFRKIYRTLSTLRKTKASLIQNTGYFSSPISIFLEKQKNKLRSEKQKQKLPSTNSRLGVLLCISITASVNTSVSHVCTSTEKIETSLQFSTLEKINSSYPLINWIASNAT